MKVRNITKCEKDLFIPNLIILFFGCFALSSYPEQFLYASTLDSGSDEHFLHPIY